MSCCLCTCSVYIKWIANSVLISYRCAKCSVWKIREAASRALLTLLSQTELTKCIELLYSNGLGAKYSRQNHIHGLLLMLRAILLDMFPTDWGTAITTINLLFKISWIGGWCVAS